MRQLSRYAAVLCLVAAAFLLRIAIEKLAGTTLPTYITFYPCVMFTALILGLGPGLLATVASALLADYFIVTPYVFGHWGIGEAASMILFSGMGVFMTLVEHRYNLIRERLETLVEERTGKLSRAMEEWETTFDSIPDLIAIIDDQQRIIRLNRAMADHLNLEPAQCIGKSCFMAMHGTDTPPSSCPHKKSMTDLKEHISEVHGISFCDTFLVSTNPLFNRQGRAYATVHVARDITELKQNERSLHEKEERLQLFIGHAPAALAMFDREMRYINVSNRWRSDYGLGERDLIGVCHYDVFPEIPEQWREAHRRGMAGEVLNMEVDRFERTDGSVQWVRWEIRPWRDPAGNIGGIVIFAEEISERKQTEELLRFLGVCSGSDSKEGFFQELARYLAQALNMDFVCIDRLEEGNLSARTLSVFHNGEFEDNVSYALKDTPCGDVVGQSICCFPKNVRGLFPRDDVLQDLQAESYLGTTLWDTQGKPIGLIAVIGRKPLKDTRIAESILQIVSVRAAGELERRLSEEALQKQEMALKKSHDELEHRVAERTNALADTVETLLTEISEREKAESGLLRLNRLYAVLSETNQAIVRVSDRDTLFQDFSRIAVKEGGFLLSWVGVVDEMNGKVRMLAASGATAYLDEIQITANEERYGEGPTGISIRTGTYCICNDFQSDPRTRPWHERGRTHGIKSSASVALKDNKRVIGALTLYAGEKDFFDKQHVDLLVQMGQDISFAIDNMNREERRQAAEKALQEETIKRLGAIESLRRQELVMIQQNRHAAMGEMIGNIAHQWRQPLNTLGLFTQSLGFFYGSPSFNKEFLDTSVAKSMEIIQYMSRTIDDFRNFFSTEREKSEFKADDAVRKALSLVEAGFKECQITINLDIREHTIIYGFPNEYAQVLLNLFLNARDVINERNVESPCLKISIGTEHAVSVLTVSDNAGGIPENIIEKIFDPYFTTKGPQQGTGVGLFMSKAIIENNMGGRLSVRNTEEGAEFRIEV
jgi:PAS domain S-box-containing protein